MNQKIIILYDTPMRNCDKLWVASGLRGKGYEVGVLSCPCSIFQLEKKGKMGRLFAKTLIMLQCIWAVFITGKTDVIFCWNHWTGLIMNMLAGKKRRIISYNWLTPQVNPKTRWVYAKALQNPKLAAIINCEDNYERLLNDYQVKDNKNIYYIPDVYDDAVEFQTPQIPKGEKYCFMGGIENRDWELLFEVAGQCPDIQFVGVTSKSVKSELGQLPVNVRMYYDVTAEEYYEMMEKSYLCICLLREERVSGLINILKAAQLGKIMLVTKTAITQIYYPAECKKFLVCGRDAKAVKEKIECAYQLSAAEYEQAALTIQHFIQNNYAPARAIDKLEEIINS